MHEFKIYKKKPNSHIKLLSTLKYSIIQIVGYRTSEQERILTLTYHVTNTRPPIPLYLFVGTIGLK